MNDTQELHNLHKGQRCVILGNGPSLNKVDFDLLQNEITFGVNSIFLKTNEIGFRTTYYVVEDNLVFKENLQSIDDYSGVTKILPKEYAAQLHNKDNLYSFEMNQNFYNKRNKETFGIPVFNTSDKPIFYCGQTVTYINLQLAFYMGFTEVIMVGMDFSYVKPKGHEQKGNHIHSNADDENHFHADYFGKGKTWKDPRLGRVMRCYHHAKFMYESYGRKIINATNGGKLELFPREKLKTIIGR